MQEIFMKAWLSGHNTRPVLTSYQRC